MPQLLSGCGIFVSLLGARSTAACPHQPREEMFVHALPPNWLLGPSVWGNLIAMAAHSIEDCPPKKDPIWKPLFGKGAFQWSFGMRKGDAESFFAPSPFGDEILAEKRKWLDESPDRYAMQVPVGEKLVDATWNLAQQWGQLENVSPPERNLLNLGRLWEPDILIIDAETMTFAAACVCMPSSWSLENTVGKSLWEVHELVPLLNQQIGEKIDRFLKGLRPKQSYCRENWGLTRSDERNYHPALMRERLDESVSIEEVYLRVEKQIFTSLPGGVLMGLRVESCPMVEMAQDRDAWMAFYEKLQSMPSQVAVYKGIERARAAILREMTRIVPDFDAKLAAN